MTSNSSTPLPLVLAGPVLRAVTKDSLTLWLATTEAVRIKLTLQPEGEENQHYSDTEIARHCTELKCAGKLYLQLLHLPLRSVLPTGKWITYDVKLTASSSDTSQFDNNWQGWQQWAPDLVYPGRDLPGFVLQSKLCRLLHGSCRKPHYPSDDGLLAADLYLQQHNVEQWPALLMLTGDQIYADDVAAPMLRAIHRLIERLDFHDESLPCSAVASASELHSSKPYYYRRDTLLPKTEGSQAVITQVFKGAKKPVFTSDNARNHLMSLAEMLGMYLLVWSPAGWQDDATQLEEEIANELTDEQKQTYDEHQQIIQQFATGLGKVRRVLAHLPSAMIFDDHDVTDDWNLTAEWEQTAYSHDFSRRIIGNALISYLLCQAWGNTPATFDNAMLDNAEQALQQSGSERHQQFITRLLKFEQWHYQWPTEPPLLVLDTRTRRWRSEVSISKPSGLLDWEAITELQQDLIGHDAVVLIAPAPVFGVKLIESIQKVFTFFGKPLLVDAENWMAHRGTAYALINIFRHPKTPKNFVILSGDVHYSFVYEVNLRAKQQGPDIWQVTSSGLKNQFPTRLLDVLDRLNRWLYSPRSPLNWFTKRRRMKIVPHKPDNAKAGERLLNRSGIGLIELNTDGSPKKIMQLTATGEAIEFNIREGEAHWE